MSVEQHKALVRRFLEQVWNQGNLAALDELFAAECVGHDPSRLKPVSGRESLRQFIARYQSACPDLRHTSEAQLAEGELVARRWTLHGTHQGQFVGVPPTGKRITVAGINIERIANGKIAESWTSWDTLGLLRQLGAIPTPGRPTVS